MLNALIVGASGYAGAQLAHYLHKHPHIKIAGLTVSEKSQDAGKLISDFDLHPQLKGLVSYPYSFDDKPVKDELEKLKQLICRVPDADDIERNNRFLLILADNGAYGVKQSWKGFVFTHDCWQELPTM